MEQNKGRMPFSCLEEMRNRYLAAGWKPEETERLFEDEYRDFGSKVIVLDDDPTGIQTVHDIDVYTDWNTASLREGFDGPEQMFFVLTNSRSFSAQRTEAVHREIGKNIIEAAGDREYCVISRGDSTLRGHYPLETMVLRDTITEISGQTFAGEILCPFFREGGRYTFGGVHYVKEGDTLVPAGETEFAGDNTFGYVNSELTEYIREKYRLLGIDNINTELISLDMLRSGNPDEIVRLMAEKNEFCCYAADAVEESDVKALGIVLMKLAKLGKHYLIRSAAAAAKVMGNVSDRPLLTGNELLNPDVHRGGMVLAGSHVAKTTRQLEELKKSDRPMSWIEFHVDRFAEENGLEDEAVKAAEAAEEAMDQGKTAVVYTSRVVLTPENASGEELLAVSVRISDAVTSVVARLKKRPGFLIAKGGITSSDVGTKALAVKKARAAGQVQPGIPVWKTGPESRFPGLAYIIFPGNVGEETTLRKIVEELQII